MVLVMEARLVAIEQRKRGAGHGERIERNGEAVSVGHVIVILIEALFLRVHAVLEESRFDSGVATETPMGGGELMDEIGFGFSLRREMIQVGAELGLVFVGGFVEQDDGLRGEPMSDGVESGGLLAGFGEGAVGFCSVGARGGDFAA